MARLKTFYLYPYSGWEELPWNQGRGATAPYDEDTLDLDATARTSGRVFESISWGLQSLGIDSRRSSYSVGIMWSESDDVEARPNLDYFAQGFVGNIAIPRGFRFVAPDLRAELLLSSLSTTIRALAAREGWEGSAIDPIVAGFRDSGYTCEWTSQWKSTRDRRLRVQMSMRLADDGYGRWRMTVARGDSDAVVVQTEEVLGWTWIENFVRSFKSMRFISPRVLEVGSGSGILDRAVRVDIETGEVHRREPDPVPLSYPGDQTRVSRPPKIIVP